MPDVADNQRIFVNIASYADPELPRTLKDCLENARRPENLRFGICWQGDPARPVPLESFRSDDRFRFSDHPVEESGGGCWARNIAQGLWRGEQYTLQIDSHMKFEPDWDTRLVARPTERAHPFERRRAASCAQQGFDAVPDLLEARVGHGVRRQHPR